MFAILSNDRQRITAVLHLTGRCGPTQAGSMPVGTGDGPPIWAPRNNGRRAVGWIVGAFVALAACVALMDLACSRIVADFAEFGDDADIEPTVSVPMANECSERVFAGAGGSSGDARANLEQNPIVVDSAGTHDVYSVGSNADYSSGRFFLAYQVGDATVVVRDFDVQQLDFEFRISSDCVTATITP